MRATTATIGAGQEPSHDDNRKNTNVVVAIMRMKPTSRHLLCRSNGQSPLAGRDSIEQTPPFNSGTVLAFSLTARVHTVPVRTRVSNTRLSHPAPEAANGDTARDPTLIAGPRMNLPDESVRINSCYLTISYPLMVVIVPIQGNHGQKCLKHSGCTRLMSARPHSPNTRHQWRRVAPSAACCC